jgi:two-component system chemotaxis response regulator CheY
VKPKLLIVDDSNVSRLMIKGRVAVLQPDWEVIEATSGDEAVALVTTAKPDFITMDVNMPGITGFEAAEKIRQTDQRVKIVILTANIQSSSRDKAEHLAAKFVQKPVTQASMQQAIDYFLATP